MLDSVQLCSNVPSSSSSPFLVGSFSPAFAASRARRTAADACRLLASMAWLMESRPSLTRAMSCPLAASCEAFKAASEATFEVVEPAEPRASLGAPSLDPSISVMRWWARENRGIIARRAKKAVLLYRSNECEGRANLPTYILVDAIECLGYVALFASVQSQERSIETVDF